MALPSTALWPFQQSATGINQPAAHHGLTASTTADPLVQALIGRGHIGEQATCDFDIHVSLRFRSPCAGGPPQVAIHGPTVVRCGAGQSAQPPSPGQSLLDALVDLSHPYPAVGLALIRALMPLTDDLAQCVREAGAAPIVVSAGQQNSAGVEAPGALATPFPGPARVDPGPTMQGVGAISSMQFAPLSSLAWTAPPAYLSAGQHHPGIVPHFSPTALSPPASSFIPTKMRAAPPAVDLQSAPENASGASGLRWRVHPVDHAPAGVAADAAEPQHQALPMTVSHADSVTAREELATTSGTLITLPQPLATAAPPVTQHRSCSRSHSREKARFKSPPHGSSPFSSARRSRSRSRSSRDNSLRSYHARSRSRSSRRRHRSHSRSRSSSRRSKPRSPRRRSTSRPSRRHLSGKSRSPPRRSRSRTRRHCLSHRHRSRSPSRSRSRTPPPIEMSDRHWKASGTRDSTTERSAPTSRSRVGLTLRVSRLPMNDRWETMLQHIFRGISRILALDVDFDRGTGRLVLAEKHRVALRAVECSWVVLSGVLFEIVEPFRNPTPRPIFVVLNLPTDSNYYNVIMGFVAAARARGVYDVSLDLMDESPLPGKRSWFGFLTVFPRSTSAIMAMDGTTLPGAMGPLRLIKVDDPPAFFARDSRDLAKLLEEYRDVIV